MENQNIPDDILPVSEVESQEEIPPKIEPVSGAVSKTRLNKWFFILLLVIGVGSLASIYLLNLRSKTTISAVLPDQISLLPLISFEFKEPLEKWEEHIFNKRTLYKVETDESQGNFLHAVSAGTSSVLFKVVNVKLSERPFLTWEWRAIQFPSNKKNEVLAAKPDNDFAARVYVAFKGRTPFSSDVIQYVWDDHFPEGAYVTSPYSRKVKVFVVQSGETNPQGEWVPEKRDLVKDYEMLYGKTPHGNLYAVGIMSDSDNTGTASEAGYRRLSVAKPKV